MTKKDLLDQAKAAGIEVSPKLKVAEIKELIEAKKPTIDESVAEPDKETETEELSKEAPLAKAGKRSSKAIKEAEEVVAKEERKSDTSKADKPLKIVKPTRPKIDRQGKNFRKASEGLEKDKVYSLSEAIDLAKKTSYVKFDATVELHVNLGVDPKHADQNVRDNLVLPSGSGKTLKVAVLSDDPTEAKKAGADIAGLDDLLAQIDKGNLGFDVLIATPNLMPRLGKYARVLGPRGLMPNPKSGTVTNDVNKAIAEAKAGRIEYRVDSTGIVHLGVGKVSFSEKQLLDNFEAVLTSIKSNKPQSLKGSYLKSAYVSTTMGPSLKIDLSSIA
jgi:large subunit ribosomal protein L1